MSTAANPISPPPPTYPPKPLNGVAPGSALVPAGEKEAPSALHSVLAINPESPVARLPVEVEISVPLQNFRVRNLLALEPDVVVASQWSHGEDLPLAVGDVQLAWTEFDVVETGLAARITRIA